MVKLVQSNSLELGRRRGSQNKSNNNTCVQHGRFQWHSIGILIGTVVVLWLLWMSQVAQQAISRRPYSYYPPPPQHQHLQSRIRPPSFANVSALSPLRPLDYEQFTVRINSWKREDGLAKVMLHLLTCESVAQVQVIWCTAQGKVPNWLRQLERKTSIPRFPESPVHRVVVEEHDDNSLNARFDLMGREPPTAGILTQDDDVYRTCLALDSAFAIWTLDPDRMVGFDPRLHGKYNKSTWFYDSWNLPNKTNQYSFTLTKFAFLHKDYLKSYTTQMPPKIRDHITKVQNCEDIAMAFWISLLTHKAPPLLADKWATDTVIDVKVNKGLSNSGKKHTNLRHVCVDKFATILKLKRDGGLPVVTWLHDKNNKHRLYKKYLQAGVPGHKHPQYVASRVVQILLQQRQKITQLKTDQRIEQEIARYKQELTMDCRNVTQERFSIACHPHSFKKQIRDHKSRVQWWLRMYRRITTKK